MPTYYANFDASGGGNAGTLANPWETMADAIAGTNGTQPVDGDTILCRGTDAPNSTPTCAVAGTINNGYIKWIGVDSNWGNVGGTTRATLSGINLPANSSCYFASNIGGQYFENFEFTGATGTGYGYSSSGAYVGALVNCIIHANGSTGVNNPPKFMIKCSVYDNGSHGITASSGAYFAFCAVYDNTSSGLNMSIASNSILYGCTIYRNTVDGLYAVESGLFIANSVMDRNGNNGISIEAASDNGLIVGCRITNHNAEADDAGIDFNSSGGVHLGWNYISNNGDSLVNDSLPCNILVDGIDTNSISADAGAGSPALCGYTSITTDAENYNLTSDALYRREAVTIP